MESISFSAIIAWLVIGAIAGWLASVLAQSSETLISDLIVGAIGAFIGGFLFTSFTPQETAGLSLWTLAVAFVAAFILLAVMHRFTQVDHLA